MNRIIRDTVWERLDRIAEKLSGVYWYSDYHGFDSAAQDCGCRPKTHVLKYERVTALLAKIDSTLDSAGFGALGARKVVQTELGEREYDLLSVVAKRHGLTIKEAARRALFNPQTDQVQTKATSPISQ